MSIKLYRMNDNRDILRNYEIFINGQSVGKIKMGEMKELNLQPGKHTIQLKIDWCCSPKLEFELKDEEIVELECGSSMTSWRLFFMYLYITIFYNKYIWLKEKH